MPISSILKALAIGICAIFAYLILASPSKQMQPMYLGEFPPPDLDTAQINPDRLAHYQKIQFPQKGVEDVEVDSAGNIYTAVGVHNSSIYRIRPDNLSRLELIATNNGPILGLCLSPSEKKLALADQNEGLKILDLSTGVITTLVSQFEDKPFISLNSITFADQETIFFTHTGDFAMTEYHWELLSKHPTGRIYKYDMKTGKTQIFLNNLHFPNGITYSKQDNCLYCCHLNKYEIIKIPLGQQNGKNQYSVVFKNIPGFPDNLKITKDNKLWIALPSQRDAVTNMIDNNPSIRKMLINSKIPLKLFLSFANFELSGAIKIDPNTGKVEDYFLGKSSQIFFVTGATERGNKLYMSCLIHDFIAVFDY